DPYVAPPPARPYIQEVGADVGRLRIGVRTAAFGGLTTTHPDCVAAAEDAARLLESLGHSVEPADLPALDDADYTTHFITGWTAGTAWNLDHWSRLTGQEITADDVEPLTWALAEAGRAVTAPQWLAAREWLQAHARRVQAWWTGGFDLMLTPTLGEPPPPLGSFASPPENPLHGLFRAGEFVPFTPLFNVTGQPAISLPLHWNDASLPIGVQLVAAFGAEDVLLRVAAQLEAARPWADRRPPVHA
ncbi:MAG TPA: amidase family protein, partial [Acidimicrobiales bacterium]|nr:amidase family protein [Acidimicrobiales bacterium]